MVCPHCGEEIMEQSQFCGYCGALVITQRPQEVPQPEETEWKNAVADEDDDDMIELLDDDHPLIREPQAEAEEEPEDEPALTEYEAPAEPEQPQYPMGWYNFLVKIALFVGAFLNAVNGLSYLTGSVYVNQGELTMEQVQSFYQMVPPMRMLDIGFALAMFMLAAMQLLCRSQLKKFMSTAPKALTTVYALSICGTLAYNIAACMILGASIGQGILDILVASLTSLGFMIYNISYFKKRKDLFVN